MDTTVYIPQNIEESAYPGEENQNYSSRKSVSNGVYKPVTIEDNPFPKLKIVNDIVGGSMNTISGQVYNTVIFNQPVTL